MCYNYVMNIEYKVIPGYENYVISNYGDIINTDTGHNLKHTLRKGYHGAVIYKNGKGKIVRVHNLMARVFEDNWDESLVAAHLDGDKDNNRLDNIKLVTQKENIAHKENHGTKLYGESHPLSKLCVSDVSIIKGLLQKKTKKHNSLSNKKIATLFNVCETTISNISSGLIWRNVTVCSDDVLYDFLKINTKED